MNENLDALTERYGNALRSYLEGAGEEALLKAHDLGRAALAAHLTVLELATVHQVALCHTLLSRLPAAESDRIARLAAEFSNESLLPFDLTVRGAQEANAVLKQLNETLKEKNTEIQFQMAKLQALETLKDDLMSLIVHDLRNPLTGMLSCLDLLTPSPGDPAYEQTREIVTLAREGARKLSELVDDLLEVRKLETGAVKIKPEPTVLVELVRDAVETLVPLARLEEIRLEVEAPEPGIAASLDRRLVRRLVENLISNAIKFSQRNDAVTIAVLPHEKGVTLEVRDRGPGVAPEMRDRLFQKFGSVEARTSGAHRRGYGLGLYVVKLVATAHGGSVEAGPRDGGGSVFRVVLPKSPTV